MGFVVVFIQELATGKGVVAGFQDGDLLSYIMTGLTVVSVVGLTVWLAIEDSNRSFIDKKV